MIYDDNASRLYGHGGQRFGQRELKPLLALAEEGKLRRWNRAQAGLGR